MSNHFEPEEPSTSSRRVVRAPTRARRVALADDSYALRHVIARILRDEGFDVAEAADGRDLLDVIARFAPDVVVTDFQMPRMSGLDVLRELHGRPAPPIVLMTASPSEEVRRSARLLGAVAVLSKPFELADLLGLIKQRR